MLQQKEWLTLSHDHHHHHGDTGNIKVAFFLNLGFTIAEIIGGVLINSIAVLSDAVHDLGDSAALGLAWFLARYSQKEGDAKYSYGYRRFSLLGALINSIILIVGSLLILSEAIPRLFDPEKFDAQGMIVFALLGVAANGLAAFRMRQSESANARVVGMHLLEDVLGWIAVLIVGVLSLFVNWPVLDPLLSIGITSFILFRVVRQFKTIVELFLQAVPSESSLRLIQSRFETVNAVCSTHHVHLWSLDGEHHVLTAHLVVDEGLTGDDVKRIKRESKAAIEDLDLGIEHMTLEIEFENTDCSMPEHHH